MGKHPLRLFQSIVAAQSSALPPNSLRPGDLSGGLIIGMPGPVGVRPIHLRSANGAGVLLHAIAAAALELRSVGLECAQPGEMVAAHFELLPHAVGAGGAAQLISLVDCRLKSKAMYCCIVGLLVHPGRTLPDGRVLSAGYGEGGEDMAHFHFDRVQFEHSSSRPNSTTIYFRSGNTIPLSFRDCHFTGQASAFLKAYSGPMASVGCSFDNTWETVAPRPIPTNNWPNVLGYEEAQGEDVYLTTEPPDTQFEQLDPRRPVVVPGNIGLSSPQTSLPGIQMLHCVSTSGRLFGTSNASPFLENNVDVPSTLIHVRCVPARRLVPQPTVFWGLNEGQAVLPENGLRAIERARMTRFSPLVVIALSTPFSPMVCHGASQSAWVGVRDLTGAPLDAQLFTPVQGGVRQGPTYIYGIIR